MKIETPKYLSRNEVIKTATLLFVLNFQINEDKQENFKK